MMRRLDAAAAVFGGVLTIYITKGGYPREAIKGMIVKPEDRSDAISRAMSKVAPLGGRSLKSRLWRTQEMTREDS